MTGKRWRATITLGGLIDYDVHRTCMTNAGSIISEDLQGFGRSNLVSEFSKVEYSDRSYTCWVHNGLVIS